MTNLLSVYQNITSNLFETVHIMSNSRMCSSSFSGKRSAFLPPEVLKEFGCYGKKPRLDIKLTPHTSHSPSKSPVIANHKDPEDELWGEDLPDDVVEECVLLATQACEQNSLVRNEVLPKASIAVDHVNISSSRNICNGKSTPSTSTNLPRDGSSNFVFQQKKQFGVPKFSNAPSKTILTNNKNENIDTFSERDKRLENENKNLKEKILQKDGEVAILRTQLQKLELQIKTQSLEHRKSLETQTQKYTKQITEQKKELEVTNTQLQLQIMEATSIRNHCKVLESGSRIKFVEPESPKAGTSKWRKDDDEKRSSKKSNVASPSTQKTKQNADRFGNQMLRYSSPEQLSLVKEGTVLGLLVNQFLTEKSQPDNSWILYLRKKQNCSRKIKKAEDINKKILVLQKNNVTLENCYDAINKLITLDAVSSIAACAHVASVVWECQRIVCRQMHILSLISSVQSLTEQGTLNGIVSSLIGKPATSNCKLMTSEKWFEEEEGIESRRALGLLCALCRISSLASELTYSSQNLTSIICTSEKVEKKSTAGSSKETPVGVTELHSTSLESQKNHELPYNDYVTKPFGFLQLLRDIIFSICYQKRSKHFTGFLTASLKLISAIGRNTKLLDGGLPLISEIIRDVVFCRPQVEAVVALFELLSVLATYPMVMKSLCVNSDEKTFVDNRAIGLAYFTRESCVTQVLFRLLPVSTTTVQLRTELCYHMVHWVFTMICFLMKEECWLLSIKENRRTNCYCRSSIASGLVSTLYNSLCDMSSPNLDDETNRKLLQIFKKSIILLRVWREDKSTSVFLNRDNFEYQLLLARIDTEADKLSLNDFERKFVQQLYDKPENEDDTSSGADNEVSELYEILRIYQKSLPNHSLYFTSSS